MIDRWITFANATSAAWAPALWRASWQGGLFVIAVWAICRIFRTMPASAKSWFWWLASLQLLLRLAVVSPLNLHILPASSPPPVAQSAAENTSAALMPTVEHSSGAMAPNAVSEFTAPEWVAPQPVVMPYRVVSPERSVRLSAASLTLALWLVGILGCLAVLIRRLAAARKLIRAATPINCGLAYDLIQEFSIDYGIRSPRLLCSEEALCPLLTGWRRPAIVLPIDCESLGLSQIRMAIAHEIAHLRRRDLWLGIIPAVTQSLFFFHPLAWLSTHEWAAAREAACDSEALRMSGSSPAAYARLLLDSAQSRSSMAVLGTAFGYRLIQRRISMLKTVTGANTRGYRAACTALLVFGAVCALPWSITAQSPQPVVSHVTKPAKTSVAAHKAKAKRRHAAKAGRPSVTLPRAPLKPPVPVIRAVPPMPAATDHALRRTSARLGIAPVPAAPVELIRARGSAPSPSAVNPPTALEPRVGEPAPSKVPVVGDVPLVGNLFRGGGFGQGSGGGFGSQSPLPVNPPASLGPANGRFTPGREFSRPQPKVTVTGGSVWIHCDLVNIRTALAELFKVAHRSYMIKSDVVSDTVECSLNGVSFDLALQTILASVTQPLTFKVESGVYTIMPKSSPTTGLGGGSD